MNFLKYSLLRLLFSVLAFFLAYYVGTGLYVSIICGALIGFAVSYLAFPRLHTAAATDFNRWVRRRGSSKKAEEETDRQLEDQADEARRKQEGLNF